MKEPGTDGDFLASIWRVTTQGLSKMFEVKSMVVNQVLK